MSFFKNILIVLFSAVAAGCFPRGHPDRMDLLSMRLENRALCLGKNEFLENPNKYNTVWVSLTKLSTDGGEHQSIAAEQFQAPKIAQNACLAPFSLEIFELNAVYDVFLAYKDSGGDQVSSWRFGSEFCLKQKPDGELELFQLHVYNGSRQVCAPSGT